MIELYSLSIFYKKSDRVTLLYSVYELKSFRYFQRDEIKQWMEFFSEFAAKNTSDIRHVSIPVSSPEQEKIIFHCRVRNDGLSGVVTSSEDYPQRIAHNLIKQVLNEFTEKIPTSSLQQSLKNKDSLIPFPPANELLSKYQDPRSVDNIFKIQEDLEETKIILENTIKLALERGEKLDELLVKAEKLCEGSRIFYKRARKIRTGCCNLT